jgi:hypothetical protein
MAFINLKASIDKDTDSHGEALQQAFDTLLQMAWTGRLQLFYNRINLNELSIYFTSDWLTDDHELVMLNSLKEDLIIIGKANESFIKNMAFMELLGNTFRSQHTCYTEKSYEWL